MIRPLALSIVLMISCAPSEASPPTTSSVVDAAPSTRADDVPADPRRLARGRTYRTSAPAPFFVTPRRTGRPDRTLPAQTIFRVEEIMEKAPPWYEITILDTEDRPAGRGYVDAKDLLDQQIVELRPAGDAGNGHGAEGIRVDPRRLEIEQSYRLDASCPMVNEPAASAPS